MPTILITSAGSLACDAIMRCLAGARDTRTGGSLTVVGVNSVVAPVAFACDRLYRVPLTADAPACEAALRRVIARERPDIVLPGRDEDVSVLTGLAASGEFPETVFAVPPPSLLPVFVDKRHTHRFACDHGLPFAPTAEGPAGAQALAQAHGYPLLAKPWSGAGSRDVFLLRDAADVARASGDPRMMVQAFLGKDALDGALESFHRVAARGMPWHWAFEDVETTAELTIGPDGKVSSICLDCGTTAPPLRTAVRLLDDDAVASVGLAWARVLAAHGHRGVVNIQGKRLTDGRFVPYEVGARFGGTAVSRAALGHNQVLCLVAGILGWPAPVFANRTGAIGLRPRRTTVPGAWWRQFETRGEWQAPAGGHGGIHTDVLSRDGPWPGWVLGGPGRDRLAIGAWALRHGLPFAPLAGTVTAAADLASAAADLAGAAALPLIAKPRWGDGPVWLVETAQEVEAALATGETVVQSLLSAGSLAAQRTAWRTRPGAPWGWAVADTVDIAEAEVGADGHLSPVRTASVTQRTGTVVEIRPTHAPAMVAIFRHWAEALIGDGHRGPLRISGKGDANGQWLPFSVSPRPLGLPDGDVVETRIPVPGLAVPET
jgi:biotin carboxylase